MRLGDVQTRHRWLMVRFDLPCAPSCIYLSFIKFNQSHTIQSTTDVRHHYRGLYSVRLSFRKTFPIRQRRQQRRRSVPSVIFVSSAQHQRWRITGICNCIVLVSFYCSQLSGVLQSYAMTILFSFDRGQHHLCSGAKAGACVPVSMSPTTGRRIDRHSASADCCAVLPWIASPLFHRLLLLLLLVALLMRSWASRLPYLLCTSLHAAAADAGPTTEHAALHNIWAICRQSWWDAGRRPGACCWRHSGDVIIGCSSLATEAAAVAAAAAGEILIGARPSCASCACRFRPPSSDC